MSLVALYVKQSKNLLLCTRPEVTVEGGGGEIHPLLRFFEHNEKTAVRSATVFAFRGRSCLVVVVLQPQVVADRFKTCRISQIISTYNFLISDFVYRLSWFR